MVVQQSLITTVEATPSLLTTLNETILTIRLKKHQSYRPSQKKQFEEMQYTERIKVICSCLD
jgi:hypothetical protein